MKDLIKQRHFIHMLHDSDKKVRDILLKNATPDQRRILMEILVNIVNGNVSLTSKQKDALKKHKNRLRKLCDSCYKNKKVINNQKMPVEQIGGALPFLLGPIISLIAKATAAGALSAGTGYLTSKLLETSK